MGPWFPQRQLNLRIVSKHVNCGKDNRAFAITSPHFLLKETKKRLWEYYLLRALEIILSFSKRFVLEIGNHLWWILLYVRCCCNSVDLIKTDAIIEVSLVSKYFVSRTNIYVLIYL